MIGLWKGLIWLGDVANRIITPHRKGEKTGKESENQSQRVVNDGDDDRSSGGLYYGWRMKLRDV